MLISIVKNYKIIKLRNMTKILNCTKIKTKKCLHFLKHCNIIVIVFVRSGKFSGDILII